MARISEIHHADPYATSSGISEFIEVSLSASEYPADYSVGYYNSDGTQYIAISLDDPGVTVTYDADADEYVYVISSDVFGVLVTDNDVTSRDDVVEAIALVNTSTSTVIDFYDIGGGTQNILATDGIAAGATSENLAVLTTPALTTTTLQFNQPDPTTLTYEAVNPGESGVTCFAKGTLIDTPTGPLAIESLHAGDLFSTLDNGDQPVRWISNTTVAGRGDFAPIRISSGTLGAASDLFVSPQHRILIEGWQAELLFGCDSVLVAAKHLINDQNIQRMPCESVQYFHLLFDQHQVVISNGVKSESFHPGKQTVSSLNRHQREEILTLFPNLETSNPLYGNCARLALKSFEGQLVHNAA